MTAAEAGGVPASDSICFILVCFSIGVLLRLGLKWTRIPIPYTAMLLLVGVAIGFLQLSHPTTEAFTNTLKLWLRMEPHLLLLIFLPIIGFSAAIAQEPHMLRKSWGQIMLLAWPGVVIQFLLIAFCAKYFFPYDWSWPEAFLFGAMMSATDPVAVVAVLQEVGASQKLACVIDGESLMNDGSALVIFLVLQKIVEGEPVTVGGAIAQFCLLAIVGMLLGVAFGIGTSWLLEHIFRDPTLTTIVTLLSAYSSYYTADRLVGASGLLAVVTNGFTMSLIGGRQLTMRVEDSMHAFWGVLEWGANTILFVWMGIVLAIVLPPSHQWTAITNHPIHLVPSDAGYVVVLFCWLQVARALLILLCWLPFNYTGYPMTWRSALVFVWGGLRGAVGMVMALFVFLDEKIHNPSFRSYCIFYMGTMAFFTVLINGGTTKWLLRTLGFMSYTQEQLTTLEHVVQDMDHMRDRRLRDLGPDEVLGEPEPDVVKVWTSLPTGDILAEAAANKVRNPLKLSSAAAQAAIAAGLDPQLLFDYRCRILHMVKAHYAEAYGQHLLSTQQARTLQAATDKALDKAADGLADWRLLEPNCQLRGLPRLLRTWQLHRISATLVQATVYRQQLSNLTLLVGFIHAHKHAQEVLQQHIQAVGDQPVVSAAMLSRASRQDSATGDPAKDVLERFRSFELAGKRGGAEALFVLQESEQEAAAALTLAEQLTYSHPSLPAWLRSKQAAATILTEQHDFLQHLADAGLVQQREMLLLEELMHERFRQLLQSNTGLSAAWHYSRSRPPINLLPLFDSLDDRQAAELMKPGSNRATFGKFKDSDPKSSNSSSSSRGKLSWKVFYPQQVIAHAGQCIDSIIVISKGAVKMHFPALDTPQGCRREHTVVASVGDPLGVCEIMLGFARVADLTADSMVQALLVPADVFLQLVKSVPGIYTRAWQATAAQLAAQHHHILGEHRQLAPLNMFFRNCIVERLQPGQTFEVPRTALLLTGSVRSLLPLPANFSAAVNNPKRSVSAADLLWPSNIGQDGFSSAAHERTKGIGTVSAPPARQSSAPVQLSSSSVGQQQGASNSSAAAAAAGFGSKSKPQNGHSSSFDHLPAQTAAWSNSAGNDAVNGSIPAAAASEAQLQPGLSGNSTSSSGSGLDRAVHEQPAGADSVRAKMLQEGIKEVADDLQLLAAPAELPPGDFKCLVEAMVLQVPRGPTLPGSLETTTYQALVLGKGSIHPELLLHQGSGSFSHESAHSARAAAGAAGAAAEHGLSGSSSTRSPVGPRSPFKDALSRLSRITRTEGSDGVMKMKFLQRALHNMRAEQQLHGGQHNHGSSTRQPAAAGVGAVDKGQGSHGLHTVVEVRHLNNPADAATSVSHSSSGAAPAGGVHAGQQQQQQQRSSGEHPSSGDQPRLSSELRATDVVLRNTVLRKRLLLGTASGGSSSLAEAGGAVAGSSPAAAPSLASSSASPRAGSNNDEFVGRMGRPGLAEASRLGSNSFSRRSANSLS